MSEQPDDGAGAGGNGACGGGGEGADLQTPQLFLQFFLTLSLLEQKPFFR